MLEIEIAKNSLLDPRHLCSIGRRHHLLADPSKHEGNVKIGFCSSLSPAWSAKGWLSRRNDVFEFASVSAI